MKRRDISPDSFSFACLLKAAANSGPLYAGAQLHSHMATSHTTASMTISTSRQ
ncbi:hypothetical protein KSP39_PZI001931 [Platanthera zijinensis]|uniref:Uncharacterized protein n=1 Tax=Platanthera zijinensis TaxID=2320716 RepID=A0AAP0GEA9_9ASPA